MQKARKKYRKTCHCQSQPPILTAHKAAKVLSKSRLGNSIWIHLFIQKFWHGQPLNRVIQNLSSHGCSIPIGTVIGGFNRLVPLLSPVYDLIMKKSLSEHHWYADETGWKVFEKIEGKLNHQWFLWTFKSKSTAFFLLNPSRSAKVIHDFFGEDSKGIISCDRYIAYVSFMLKSDQRFRLAYCWAHVRRDFLNIAKDRPPYKAWGMKWKKRIGQLYHLNNLRIAQVKGSSEYLKYHKQLEEAVKVFKLKVDQQQKNKKLAEPCRKALESLNRHWKGLMIFVKHPEILMDNNTAERQLRGGVVGRKNYYGSGSKKSAEFTSIMFTIIQTLRIWNLNPQEWFTAFFDFSGGVDPNKNIESWLPWNLSPEQRTKFYLKNHHDPPK